MQHAERLCDRLLLLAQGRKVFDGTKDEARAALPSRLTLTSRLDPASLPSVSGARLVWSHADGWAEYQVELRPGSEPGELLETCTQQGSALRSSDITRPTLHEVFVHFVGAAQEIGR